MHRSLAGTLGQRRSSARLQQLVASSVSSEGRPVQQVQRALGLDYGRRVVGLAVSTLGLAPRPLEGVPGCASAADQLATASAVLDVAARERCDAIVVGLPVTSTGSLRRRETDSQQGRRCRNFASTLASLAEPHGLQVFLADERGSTMEARQFLEASGSRRSTFDKVGLGHVHALPHRICQRVAALPRNSGLTTGPGSIAVSVSHNWVCTCPLPPLTCSGPAAAQGQRVGCSHPHHVL